MSTALRIAHGAFGRVALLDMDWSLVRHAHPHCHVLLKVEGADTQFVVGDKVYPLTNETAVLVNGWQPHSYVHDPERPRTVILALYIEPEWLMAFRPGWAASGAPGFFSHPSGDVSPRIRGLAMNLAADMMARPEARAAHEAAAVRPDDRGDRALHAMAKFPGIDPGDEHAASATGASAGLPPRCGPKPTRRCRLDTFAKEAGLSRAHFFRLFESSVGVPPKVYLNVVRMERAVDAVLNQIRQRLRYQQAARLCRAGAFHALLPQPCRRQPARVPQCFPSRELMLHCTSREMRRDGKF